MIPLRVAMLVMSSIVAVCWSLAGDLSGWEESEVWTVDHLRTMGSSKMATTALSRLAGGASSPDGAELKMVIDHMTPAEIGTALLGQALSVDDATYPLAKFAKFIATSGHSEGATCGQAGTAGVEGLDACTARCERKRLLMKTPPAGACYALCSMAVSPCGLRPFTLRRSLKEGCGMVGTAVTVGAKGFLILCLHLSGYTVAEYLTGVLRRYVFYDARVAIFTTLSLAGLIYWVFKLLDREIEAADQGQAPETPRAVNREETTQAMQKDSSRVPALMKRGGRNYRPTQVFLHRRRLEVAGRDA